MSENDAELASKGETDIADEGYDASAIRQLAYKSPPTRRQKFFRLVAGVFDPRAWLHLLRIVNYYNYTHVAPLRSMQVGSAPAISPDASFANGQNITIGDRARIGSRCHLWAGPHQGRIRIGNDVLMGPEVMLTAATYQFDAGSPVSDQPMREADIVIGNDVWLATRAIILPGTTIGDGAIVAAGAIVKGEVGAGEIVAGAPAKPVSRRDVFD